MLQQDLFAAGKPRNSSKVIDMTGQRYGRLVAKERAGSVRSGAAWIFVCDCGRETRASTRDVRSGNTSSCGCLLNERRAVAGKKNVRHGMSRTPTYEAWFNLHKRCNDPKHKSFDAYGGRGIRVCERWKRFDEFLLDMGVRPPGMTIDRRDNNGHYEPSNCRWATPSEQARNRRSNTSIEAFGCVKTLVEWGEDARCSVSTDVVSHRIRAGWPTEKAISFPKRLRRPTPTGGESTVWGAV